MLRIKILATGVMIFLGLSFLNAEEPEMFTAVNAQNYQEEVLNFKGPQIVFFYAKWCPYSGSLLPVYQGIEKEYSGTIKFSRFQLGIEYMDFASEEGKARWRALKENYGVEIIPALVMLNQGGELDRMSGRPEKEIVESYRAFLKTWIESNLINPEGIPYLFEGTLRLHRKENPK